MSRTIRVVVAEDSRTVRRFLVDRLESDPGLQVVGEAPDGQAAVDLCRRLKPDVVTLDLMMPGMNGQEAIEQIMAWQPTPILVISSAENRGEQLRTLDALAAGALEVLEKAGPGISEAAWTRQLVSSVRMLSRIRVITHLKGRTRTAAPAVPVPKPWTSAPSRVRTCRAVGLGASTGGPAALVQVLGALPADFPVPILVVLHLSDLCAEAMVEWFQSHTLLPVSWARDGDLPERGSVFLAPPDRHLVVDGCRMRLTTDDLTNYCRPSVDRLFHSMAASMGPDAVACLLTGMGRDGAQGLLAMRQAGAATVAQDESTSVVWGMPGEAVRLGAASAVLPLGQIASWLLRLLGRTP